jgi:hypothetical protein
VTRRFSPEQVARLGHNNAIVGAALALHNRGILSWEDCLIACVLHLADLNQQVLERCMEAESGRPTVIRFEGPPPVEFINRMKADHVAG